MWIKCRAQALSWGVARIHEDRKVDPAADLRAQRVRRSKGIVEPDRGIDRLAVNNVLKKRAAGLFPQRDVRLVQPGAVQQNVCLLYTSHPMPASV